MILSDVPGARSAKRPRNRCFRLPGSSKFGKSKKLEVAASNKRTLEHLPWKGGSDLHPCDVARTVLVRAAPASPAGLSPTTRQRAATGFHRSREALVHGGRGEENALARSARRGHRVLRKNKARDGFGPSFMELQSLRTNQFILSSQGERRDSNPPSFGATTPTL